MVSSHGHADEGEELAVPRFDAARDEHRVRRDAVLLHAALDEVDAEVDVPAHLDGAAEGDLAVTLGEVQVAAGELGARNVHGIEDAAAPGEVLDVVVAAVLAGRHRAGALPADTLGLTAPQRPGQDPVLERRQRQRRHPVRVAVDQRLLAAVPLRQQRRRRGGAEQPRVRDAGVADPGDVPRRGVLAVEVPDRLVGVREVVGEEAAAVRLGEDTGVAPSLARRVAVLLRGLARAEVEDVDDQQVTRLGALDLDRARSACGRR